MICHSTVQSSSTSGVLRLSEATAKRLLAALVEGELVEAAVVVPAWVAASAGSRPTPRPRPRALLAKARVTSGFLRFVIIFPFTVRARRIFPFILLRISWGSVTSCLGKIACQEDLLGHR